MILSVWPLRIPRATNASASHSRIVRSSPPEANSRPFDANATAVTLRSWPVNVAKECPVTSQTRTTLSEPAEATRRPSGANATALTSASCCATAAVVSRVPRLHIRTVRSYEPDTIRVPSGLNAADEMPSVCPSSAAIDAPVSTSQTRNTLSHAQVARRRPSGLKMADTGAPPPLILAIHVPLPLGRPRLVTEKIPKSCR